MEKRAADKIVIGAGLYGLYAALYCARLGQQVIVLEQEQAAFTRATYINQARVHMGYHYPRSISTAMKSAGYFQRFVSDFGFCINDSFDQIYATSAKFSWTSAAEFRKFCKDAQIPCTQLPVETYFRPDVCDGAFLTKEYSYDALLLRDYFLEELGKHKNVTIEYGVQLQEIESEGCNYRVHCRKLSSPGRAPEKAVSQGDSLGESIEEKEYLAPFVLNATYAAVNHVLSRVKGLEPEKFALKYELCEIILCQVGESLKNVGLTVMDGPFFSLMPFGKQGIHSLTSVTFTPHETDYHAVPEFACTKKQDGECARLQAAESANSFGLADVSGRLTGVSGGLAGGPAGVATGLISAPAGAAGGEGLPHRLGNCNDCIYKPVTAWEYMAALARKYMKDEHAFTYKESLYSMKPILKASEIDDSRPTVIKVASQGPTLISVLSGKINTVYDLDEFLS